jgi:hypothetical protein
MKDGKRALLYNCLALAGAIWFLLTGWIWGYLANLFISYPVACVGLALWFRARKLNPASLLNRMTLGIFIFGFIVSIAALFIYK